MLHVVDPAVCFFLDQFVEHDRDSYTTEIRQTTLLSLWLIVFSSMLQ